MFGFPGLDANAVRGPERHDGLAFGVDDRNIPSELAQDAGQVSAISTVEFERSVAAPGGQLRAFVTHPTEPGSYPVALVYIDAGGYREEIKAIARRFAREGYYCVVPDLFHRSGPEVTFDLGRIHAEGIEGAYGQSLMKAIGTVTPTGVCEDSAAVLNAVRADPAAAAGANVCVGFCMGAGVALHVASALSHEFVAVAGIHPGTLITDDPESAHRALSGVRGEVYFAFAEIDPAAPPALVEQFRLEVARKGVRGVVETVPRAMHGFAIPDSPAYHQPAATRAFWETLELWGRSLPPAPQDPEERSFSGNGPKAGPAD